MLPLSARPVASFLAGQRRAPSRRLQSLGGYWVPWPESWLVSTHEVREQPLNRGVLELEGRLGDLWASVAICQTGPPFTLASGLW